ncbi:MAG: translation initiation factor IF-3 [Candidatus Sungbacteria bacterium RIFCSPHIGHO2_02_FULL_47_11]|uniref:Translation initiation factor IF-3 n=1 Tax=Candidatus Sungbacteria bacterium RIFCSPHIGHO2_02_FULL_47_11 TaxID=1802270 RepID=A0A1G2KGK1_9BACT|nr:MAG: translation initiation factor IF-3 [Candidatus Sungbacteria bacterium RIFCSPHIGHO2_02_FULL_47_11]
MIDENGKNLGVMETAEAGKIAQERGLDLIEIAPTVQPPICKIMDFGKFKYEREKGERERGKKQKEVDVKGLRIGFATGKHDLLRYAKKIQEFLAEGNKVQIDMRLRGRERAHRDVALQKFQEFMEMIPEEFHIELPPKRLPQGFVAVITKK